MIISVEWTEKLISACLGSLVYHEDEVCLLTWSVIDSDSSTGNFYYITSLRDGMSCLLARSKADAILALNAKKVQLLHEAYTVSYPSKIVL